MTALTAAEQAEFDRQNEIADAMFDNVLEHTPEDVDEGGAAFGLWVNLTQFLSVCGWTGDELAKEVHYYSALATSEGGVQ